MVKTEFMKQLNEQSETKNMEWINNVINNNINSGNFINQLKGDRQLIITMEELAELTQEISKHLRGKGDIYNLLQEMADVQICIYTLQKIFNISDEKLNAAINVKIERLEDNINTNGYYQ